MPTTCEIEFENNPSKVVYSGQLLRGNVKLSLTKTKIVRGIFINIRGTGYCSWGVGNGNTRGIHTGSEEYLNERQYFLGGQEDVCLTPGSHNYIFECVLPPQLPTSFESEYGHIRYTACVVIDIPMWPDREFEVPFTVIKAIDLNVLPELREPLIGEVNETFSKCCFWSCCQSGPLNIKVRAPVGGYTPGQTINLAIDVNNKSNQPVFDFTAQLIQQIHYHTHANSYDVKFEKVVVAQDIADGCESNSQTILRVNMVIPSISPTDNTTSNIIKVEYLLRVIASVENVACHSDPMIYLPVVIGSIPIVDDPQTASTNSNPLNVISQQPISNNVQTPSALYRSDDPPTYEEATRFGNEKGAFRPRYPMFRRQTSYSN